MASFTDRISSVALFQEALDVAEFCAVKKGAKILTDLQSGCCSESEEKVELMFNLIDSVRCIVPEGLVISGEQAECPWNIQQSGGTATVDLTIGASVYPTMTISGATTELILAQAIVDIINSYYPQNFPYTAELLTDPLALSPYSVNIIGSDYELSNGVVGTGTVTATSGSNGTGLTLTGGVAAVYQGENAITNNDLQIILTRLCELCKN